MSDEGLLRSAGGCVVRGGAWLRWCSFSATTPADWLDRLVSIRVRFFIGSFLLGLGNNIYSAPCLNKGILIESYSSRKRGLFY